MVTDNNGNSSTDTAMVTVQDNLAPAADLLVLEDVMAQCQVDNISAPTATDNCVGSVIGTTVTTFPITEQGTTIVTWTYEDESGNTSTQTQNVIIEDITSPAPDVMTLSDVEAECQVDTLVAPTATDNCVGDVTVTNDANLPISTQGTTVITWTYEDENGNTSTQTQNVVIEDVTSPMPDVIALSDIEAECQVDALVAPTATDNCSGDVIVSNDADLPITTQGTTVITWTYEDVNGNISTQTQNVVIEDVSGRVADAGTLEDITAECIVESITIPSATDKCTVPVQGTTDTVFPITTF
jgi:predicted NAD/FAD-dependent oxidoreductase